MPAGTIALAGVLLSGWAHAASLRGIDVESTWPKVWVLHYALFPIILLAVLTGVMVAEQKRLGLRAFLTLVPAPALLLLGVFVLYVVGTFLIVTPLSGAGDPVIAGGRFFFNDHGIIREVSKDQFHFQRSASLRFYSSAWLYLYLFSVVYLAGARRSGDTPP
jgi:hypothetical protein